MRMGMARAKPSTRLQVVIIGVGDEVIADVLDDLGDGV